MRAEARPLRRLLEGATITASRGDLDVPARSVRHDSRRVEPGDLFFALDGAKARGLDFAPQALERGAAAVVAAELSPVGEVAVAVEQVREAMALAACEAAGHPTAQVPTVGITGTNGKTTTTYLLEAAYRALGRQAAVIGTIDTRLGPVRHEVSGFTTPEAPELQRLAAELVDAGAEALLLEVTSHGLKLERVRGSRFRVVAFTNLTQDHLDLHGSMEDYAATKLRLFTDELDGSPEAVAVVNVDDPFGRQVAEAARCSVLKVSAAGASDAAVRVVERELSVEGFEATIEVEGRRVPVRCPLVGEHNVANVTLALGICHGLELELDRAASGFAHLERVPGRTDRVDDPRGSLVLVDYAHTPDALSRVTESLARFTRGRLLVVFGCGGDRDRSKRPQMGAAAARGGDLVVLTSDNPRTEEPLSIISMALPGVEQSGLPRLEMAELAVAPRGFVVEPDRRAAIAAAVTAAGPDDVVLIAGKGHEDYQILGERKIHFDDREEAAAAIAAAVGRGRTGEEVSEQLVRS